MQPSDLQNSDLGDIVAAMVGRHGEKWLRFVMRIVGNQEDAEDVLQEAVHRVLLRNRAFRTDEEVRMYLSRAISNAAFDLYDSRKRERLRCLPLREHNLTDARGHDPHAFLEQREHSTERARQIELLTQALSRLPAKQYEAVRLTVMDPENTSIRDAGIERGIPYSTLRHRSVQGIRRLKKFLRRARLTIE